MQHWTEIDVVNIYVDEDHPEGSLGDLVAQAEQGDEDSLNVLGYIEEFGEDGAIAVWAEYWLPGGEYPEDIPPDVDWSGCRKGIEDALRSGLAGGWQPSTGMVLGCRLQCETA